MHEVFVTILLVILGAMSPGQEDRGPWPSLREEPPSKVGRFATYEVAFDLSRRYDDPFDPEVIDVEATFISPAGREISVNGFWFQDYPLADLMQRCERGASHERPPAAGGHADAHWKVRFSPQEEGRYRGHLVVRDSQGSRRLELPEFDAVESSHPGFIRARPGQRILEHETGRPFVPIGECVWHCYSLGDFEDALAVYPRWGMNYCRFFTAYDSPLYIDNAFYAGGSRRPTGHYDLFALRQLDLFFEIAARHGVYVMPCLEMFNAFRSTPPYARWNESSYNVNNGGPCRSVAEFFTDERAIRLYERKIRYFLARYGHSPNLFCIQLFAEANYIEHYAEADVRAWHHRIGRFIHAIDPYGHLVSTSLADWEAQDKTLYADPALDLVLNENYNARDFAGDLIQDNQGIIARYGKPVFDGEAGLQFGELHVEDDRGLFLHNGIWASVLSGACGTPSNWFHYVAREKHWLPSYKAFADFLAGRDLRGLAPIRAKVVDWEPRSIHPDQIIPFPFTNPREATGPQTVVVPNDRFIEQPLPNMPTIFNPKHLRDGESPNPNFNPVTFDVDFPADGVFRVRVRWLEDFTSGHARMRILVDGRLAQDVRLGTEGETKPDWNSRMTSLASHSVPFAAEVTKGRHTIVLENHGTIWASAEVDLSNYLHSGVPNIRVVGLGSAERAFVWIQNRDSTWWRDCLNEPPRPIERATIEIAGFAPGGYRVEWRDPWGVEPTRSQVVEVSEETLRLPVSRLERDVACAIERVPAGAARKNLVLPGDVFEIEGKTAFLFEPAATGTAWPDGMPWILYAPTLPAYPDDAERWMHETITRAGVAVAGIDSGESYGSQAGLKAAEALHAEMVRRGYSRRPAVLGRSRGGLWASAWAIAHPEFTAGLGGIYPVYDWRTYPGLDKAAEAYGLSPAELAARAAELCPIERIGAAAEAGVPVCIIHGDDDAVVPLGPNSAELKRRYEAAGRAELVQLIVAEGQGHSFWEGFFRCRELVDFLIARARTGTERAGPASVPE